VAKRKIEVKKSNPAAKADQHVLFEAKHFKIFGIGLGLIFLGLILMIGGGSDDPNEWNEAIYSARRTVLAPILILAGLALQIVGILKK
jgi:hypothetical protein